MTRQEQAEKYLSYGKKIVEGQAAGGNMLRDIALNILPPCEQASFGAATCDEITKEYGSDILERLHTSIKEQNPAAYKEYASMTKTQRADAWKAYKESLVGGKRAGAFKHSASATLYITAKTFTEYLSKLNAAIDFALDHAEIRVLINKLITTKGAAVPPSKVITWRPAKPEAEPEPEQTPEQIALAIMEDAVARGDEVVAALVALLVQSGRVQNATVVSQN